MSSVDTALRIVSSANLSPTEHILLKGFVNGAVDPELAAIHLLSRVDPNKHHSLETDLSEFKKDWRRLVTRLTAWDPIPKRLDTLVRLRDGPGCCISKASDKESVCTGETAYLVPPSMLHGLETVEEGRLYKMLEAHLSPPYVAKLRLQLVDQAGVDEVALRNLWLLSPSVHRAFREGHLAVRLTSRPLDNSEFAMHELDEDNSDARHTLETMYPESLSGLFLGDGTELEDMVRFRFSTPNAENLPIPSLFLFAVHRWFAKALHLFYIEKKIAHGWPKSIRDYINLDIPILRKAIHQTWLCMPFRIRLSCYMPLKKVGRRLYGPATPFVQRLPFGLVLKECVCSGHNEPNALKLVAQYTSIPAPRVVDVWEQDDTVHLVMTHLRGRRIREVMHRMSYPERNRLADELGSYVEQLRKIPKNSAFLFCNTLGGRIVDHRLPDRSGGPFNSESEFNNHLSSHLKCSPAEVVGKENLREDHRSYFTHCDFHCTNLLVHRGRLSGIVDWECAGYTPEYWEYTKAIYGALRNPILESIFRRAFGGRYEAEFDLERKFWRYTPFGV